MSADPAPRKPVRPFGPSNEPGTCLYCGATLKHDVWKAHTLKNTVTLCCQARTEQHMEHDTTGIAGWRSVLRCSVCHRELVGDAEDTETRVTEVPEKRSAQAGYAGWFCTRDCGYRFGVLAAEKGVRYKKRADPEG